MFALVLGLFLWIPAIIGWGIPSCAMRKRLAAGEYSSGIDVAELITGFVLIASFVIVVNFWTPINSAIGLLTLSMGWISFLWRMRRYGKPQIDWRWACLGVAWLIITALLSSGPIKNDDAGLYHIQSIKWLKENPAPFGLANLHGRLGFNSSWFVLAAVIDLPYLPTNYALMSAVLIWMWGVFVINFIVKLFNYGILGRFHDLFATLTPVVFLSTILNTNLSSPSPDLPVLLLMLLVVFLILEMGYRQVVAYQLWVSFLVVILLITIKLSAIPWLLMPLSLLLANLRRKDSKVSQRVGFIILGSPLILLGPWLIRNIVLSGCLIYPINATCMHSLPWSVSGEQVAAEAAGIQSWARAPWLSAEVATNWNWLGNWWANLVNSDEFRGLTASLLLGILVLVIVRFASKGCSQTFSANVVVSILPGVISVIGLVYWFVSAPDIRFGAGYLWAFVLLVLCNAVYELLNCRPFVGIAYWRLIRFLLVSSVFAFVFSVLLTRVLGRAIQLVANPQTLIAPSAIPIPSIEILSTIGKTDIYCPVNADQCWGTSLPCTPYCNKALQVIKSPDGQFVTSFYFK